MKTYLTLFPVALLLGLGMSSLVQAQATCTPEHAAMGHCTMDAPQAEVAKPEAAKPAPSPEPAPMKANQGCTAEHAAMGHCKMDAPAEPPKQVSKPKKVKKAKTPAATQATAKPDVAKPLPQASQACTPEHAAMGHCTIATPQAAKPKPAVQVKPAAKPVQSVANACTPEHAAMGHCTLDKPQPVMTKPNVLVRPTPKLAPKPINPPKATSCTPEHAAMGHCTMPTTQAKPQARAQVKPVPTPKAPPSNACTPEHAAMGHCTMDAPQPVTVTAKPSSTCKPEHAAMGHCTLESGIPVSDGSAKTNIPMPYHHAMDMNDDPLLSKVMIDRLEVHNGEHGNPVVLEADAWFGKSIDKLWLKTDIEAVDGDIEEAQLQVLYNRAITPFWDIQAGLRQDFKPVKRTWAALGVQGTAPYFIETKATGFLGKGGQSSVHLSAEKEVMLTQKTVLIPEIAMTMYGKDDHELGVGSGLSDLNVGLRLSHEIKREFAPYIGVNWSKKLGKTADMAEHHGEKTQDTEFLLGIQAWF